MNDNNKEAYQINNKQSIYDLGFGAKSTVRMKAISGNRYVVLHDEADEDSQIGTSGVKDGDLTIHDEANKDMVPETQPISDTMAT